MTRRKKDAESQRELELIGTVSTVEEVEVRLRARGDPAPALLHEPLQRRLPSHRQACGCDRPSRPCLPRRGGQQARRPVRGHVVEHQNVSAVDDGHLGRRGLGIFVTLRRGGVVGARHEWERPRGVGHLGRLDVPAGGVGRCCCGAAIAGDEELKMLSLWC
jgi:hypothetical protein